MCTARRGAVLLLALAVSAALYLRGSTVKPQARPSSAPVALDAVRRDVAARSLVSLTASAARSAPRLSIWGFVKGEHGSPLPGANLCPVTPLGIDDKRCVVADAAGRYVLSNLGAESQALFASAAGHLSLRQPLHPPLDAEGGRREVSLRLEPGGAPLAGSVVDATGGVVVGAAVTFRSNASRELLARAESDPEGRFALSASKDDGVIRAEAEGYSSAHAAVSAPAGDLRLVLAPAATIEGRVVAAGSDEPLPSIEVRAKTTTFAETHTAVSRADGSFELQALLPGRYQLEAAGSEWTLLAPRWASVGASEISDTVVLRLVPASTLHATIRVDGAACSNGYVELSGPRVTVATSGADGVVHVEGLPRGDYRLTVGCLDESCEAVTEELAVSTGPVSREWDLRAAVEAEDPSCCQPSGTILARVRDEGSRPSSSLGVRLSQAFRPGAIPVTTSRRGDAVVFDKVALGAYDVYLEQSPETRARVELVRDGQVSEVQLRAPSPLEITGTVLDEHDGPVPDAWVSATPLGDPRASAVAARALTGLDGTFTLGPVFTGPHALQVDAASGSARVPSVQAGSRDVVLRVEARGALTLRAPNATGNLSSLYWRRHGDSSVRWMPGSGTWSVPSMPPGSYDVVVVTEAGFAARDVVIEAHAVQDVTLEVEPKSHDSLPNWVREHPRRESLARVYTGQEK